MPLNARFAIVPRDALIVSDSLAIHVDNDLVAFFDPAGPFFTCRRDDKTSLRTGAVLALRSGLAGSGAVADALGIHRTTLYRAVQQFERSGVEGLVPNRRGPKGPSKLTATVIREVENLLDEGTSIRATAAEVGISERGLRHAIARGLVDSDAGKHVRTGSPPSEGSSADIPLSGPRERALTDQACVLGVATTREIDRTLACVGSIDEAKPKFEAAEAVPGAGALLALPALLEEGLIEVGTSVYGNLRNAFFGLRSILLTFAFMALRRIRSPEQLTEHAPGEFGFLLGLDRVPEVKTLRRKLKELGERRLADMFAQKLAERWASRDSAELAILYVDGHVRPYHGRKHDLPSQKVTQLGRFMPGTKEVYVNDQRSEPLLFVSTPANEGLLTVLDSVILPDIRGLLGPGRRVTLTFDREGWSPRLFAKWKSEGFDVLTYRKGRKPRWRTASFESVSGQVSEEEVEYCLAERELKLSNGLKVREIRRLNENGHQVSVITTNNELSLIAVAYRMFSRWKQENFFRYMRHEFALDRLCTNAVEAADPKRLVRHPERVKLEKDCKKTRAAKGRLLERRSKLAPGKTAQVGGRWVSAEKLDQLIEQHDATLKRLTDRIERLPGRVPIGEVRPADTIVRLERERKVLVDLIKLTAYRAETSLARSISSVFNRHDEEARKLLKTIFQATADIIPDQRSRLLTVRFHGLANPRATRALSELCEIVNQNAPTYPGSNLKLHFEAPMLQE
jgi:transposase